MTFFARYQGLSDPIRTERRVELIVLVLLALLLLQFGWGSYRALFPPIPDPVRPMRDSLQVANVQGLSVVSPEQRAQIRQRPLFWASRTPVVLEPVKSEPDSKEANAAQPGKIENVKLAGVFGGGNTGGVIVISKGKKRRLAVGEDLNGWKLQSVEAFSANFSSGDQQATLALSIVEIAQVQALEEQVPADDKVSNGGKIPSAKTKSNRKSKKESEVPDRLRLGGDR